MQPDLLDLHVLHHFRTRSPLTHCMTNDVVDRPLRPTFCWRWAHPRDGD